MKISQKHTIVKQLTTELQQAKCFYVLDAEGLTVSQVNYLRKLCFEKNIVYKVVKNTLIKKALANLNMHEKYAEFVHHVLKNFSGIMLVQSIDAMPAKIIQQFRKENNTEKPLLKGASIDHDVFIGDEQLNILSKLKTKEELVADLITLLKNPVQNVLGALHGSQNDLMAILKTLSEK